MDSAISILSLYIFIAIGFIAKKTLKEKLDEKTLVKLNVYFLLPILAFWGLLTQKIDFGIIKTPFIYAFIFTFFLVIASFFAKKIFKDPKDIAIASISSVTGVTGSIGIPLGITLIGEKSVIYTSLINTMSMFLVYTLGVYIYSRGNFSIKKSIVNVFKMPIIWASFLAMILNLSEISIHPSLFKSLEMGAYSAIVMQLVVFGIFLHDSKLSTINYRLLGFVGGFKFIIIPVFTFFILLYMHLHKTELDSILLEMIVPLAITNVSLASIFDCKPKEVTTLVFVTSLIFIPYVIVLKLFF